MTPHSLDNQDNIWTELPDPLCHAVKAIHDNRPSSSDVATFLDQLAGKSPDQMRQVEVSAAAHRRQPSTSATRTSPRFWRAGIAVTAAAACLVAILFVLPSSAARALDQIVRALAGQQCVKMTTTDKDGSTSEHWYLPNKNISAWRNGDWIEYRDHETQIIDSFDRIEKKRYRTANSVGKQGDYVMTLIESLISLRRASPPKQLDGLEIVRTKFESSVGDGSARQVLVLTLQNPKESQSPTVQLSVVFNTTNNLPESVTVTGTLNGVDARSVTRFEYPDVGPADVFALGAPTDAPLIDRIPSTDVERLVAGVFAGRLRFDDYRAIVIKSERKDNAYDPSGDILLIARKGSKSVYFRLADSLPPELIAKSRDEASKELLARHEQFRWCPVAVTRGQTCFSFETSFDYTQDGKQTITISEARSYTYANMKPEEFVPPAWNDYPHLAGRPPLGVGRQDIGASIATETDGGPEGCVLLQTKRSGRMPQAPADADKNGSSMLSNAGYWIRADRDFLVMHDNSSFDNGGSYQFILDELARSPQGHWYPIRARSVHGDKGGSVRTEHISYHLEFVDNLSDELFDSSRYVGKR